MIYQAYNLWLDDYRKPPGEDWRWVKSLEEFKAEVIKSGPPTLVSFDHDLTLLHYASDYSDQQTGLEAVQWLIAETPQWKPKFNVHSRNAERGSLMRQMLLRSNFEEVSIDVTRAIKEHVRHQDWLRTMAGGPIVV